jgi:hypothetical protein
MLAKRKAFLAWGTDTESIELLIWAGHSREAASLRMVVVAGLSAPAGCSVPGYHLAQCDLVRREPGV